MRSKPDEWGLGVRQALRGASPLGRRIIGSLGDLIAGTPEAMPVTVAAAAPGARRELGTLLNDWHVGLDKSIRGPARAGIAMLVLFVGCGGLWATTAPLASAVVAHGTFVATGQNKIVQHLEGGVIRDILIKEGDAVVAGQPLVQLDDTTARADARRLEIRRATLLATKARLDAERAGFTDVVWPKELEALASDEEVAKSVQAQQSLFASRREEFAAQRQINERQIAAIEQEIEGLNAQKASNEEQLDLLDEEIDSTEKLYKKGLSELSRVLQLKRAKAKMEGDIGEFVAQIGRAEQRILETRIELAHQQSKLIEEGADLYRQTTADLSDTEERLTAANRVLERQIIRAPVKGLIVKLQYHTAGGVITPGQQVAEILPTDEKLLVEAFVRPEEIDYVTVGQVAELRLTALNQRTTPLVLGTVSYVSADKLQTSASSARPGETYYLARVELDEASTRERIGDVRIAPGMPAEVYLKTGERTMLEYIMRPIMDVVHHGARER